MADIPSHRPLYVHELVNSQLFQDAQAQKQGNAPIGQGGAMDSAGYSTRELEMNEPGYNAGSPGQIRERGYSTGSSFRGGRMDERGYNGSSFRGGRMDDRDYDAGYAGQMDERSYGKGYNGQMDERGYDSGSVSRMDRAGQSNEPGNEYGKSQRVGNVNETHFGAWPQVPLAVYLKEQHDQLRVYLDMLSNTHGLVRAEIWRKFRRLLATHEAAEESVVHPLARSRFPKRSGEIIVNARLREEAAIKRMLKEMESIDSDSAAFNQRLVMLTQALTLHMAAEEAEEFLPLDVRLGQKESISKMRSFMFMQKLAPTRAHTGIGESGTSNTLLGPLRGFLDRWRDRQNPPVSWSQEELPYSEYTLTGQMPTDDQPDAAFAGRSDAALAGRRDAAFADRGDAALAGRSDAAYATRGGDAYAGRGVAAPAADQTVVVPSINDAVNQQAVMAVTGSPQQGPGFGQSGAMGPGVAQQGIQQGVGLQQQRGLQQGTGLQRDSGFNGVSQSANRSRQERGANQYGGREDYNSSRRKLPLGARLRNLFMDRHPDADAGVMDVRTGQAGISTIGFIGASRGANRGPRDDQYEREYGRSQSFNQSDSSQRYGEPGMSRSAYQPGASPNMGQSSFSQGAYQPGAHQNFNQSGSIDQRGLSQRAYQPGLSQSSYQPGLSQRSYQPGLSQSTYQHGGYQPGVSQGISQPGLQQGIGQQGIAQHSFGQQHIGQQGIGQQGIAQQSFGQQHIGHIGQQGIGQPYAGTQPVSSTETEI